METKSLATFWKYSWTMITTTATTIRHTSFSLYWTDVGCLLLLLLNLSTHVESFSIWNGNGIKMPSRMHSSSNTLSFVRPTTLAFSSSSNFIPLQYSNSMTSTVTITTRLFAVKVEEEEDEEEEEEVDDADIDDIDYNEDEDEGENDTVEVDDDNVESMDQEEQDVNYRNIGESRDTKSNNNRRPRGGGRRRRGASNKQRIKKVKVDPLVKDQVIKAEGEVVMSMPGATFRVKVDGAPEDAPPVVAQISGKIRKNNVKILVGDRVSLEFTPYDLTRGRITFRHRQA